ncbi:hypothetical protein [Corallococcus sp. CA031C]|nr:hypothetical protein [Corallococcus sp. CA031C]
MKKRHDFIAAPISRYADTLRAGQGYLFKMPAEWVDHWPELSSLTASLDETQERLAALSPVVGAPRALMARFPRALGQFRLKNDADYEAVIRGGLQRRTRGHEKLVAVVGSALQSAGAHVTMPHPLDLVVHSPVQVIFEVKTLGGRDSLFAVREAVGQLLEYRHFRGPSSASLGIVLGENPGNEIVSYVEETLGMLLIWCEGKVIRGGPLTAKRLSAIGVVGLGI